ncbi:hypothetical protein [Mesorhizobium sp. M0195]|uniref:hypothetical protein n=1 Tax=unclassified Mesorhizobium TaxID=325217 RepID=UPI00333877AE
MEFLKLFTRVHLAGDKRDRQRLAANGELARFDRIVAGQAQDQPAVDAFLLIPEQAGERDA